MSACHLCGTRLDGARATVTFEGFDALSLNGITFVVHARCLRFEPTQGRDVLMRERVSDPLAEVSPPEIVTVEMGQYGDWDAYCNECHKVVAIKDMRDDAELAAARHIARVHAGVPV